jgi:uncharacterized DUF497 family protein
MHGHLYGQSGGRPDMIAVEGFTGVAATARSAASTALAWAGGRRLIRPMSARYMHAGEVRRYEEAEDSA